RTRARPATRPPRRPFPPQAPNAPNRMIPADLRLPAAARHRQQSPVARPAPPESLASPCGSCRMKIEADRRTADPERAREDLDDKILGGCSGQRRVEPHHDSTIEPGRLQQAQLVVLITEFKQRVLGPQEKPRMRRKGQCGRLPAKRARTR